MRCVGWRTLLAAVTSIGLASTAWAGFGNRTDLTDLSNEMHADSLDSPLTGNRAFLELEASTAFASGSVSAPGTGTTTTRIFWAAFEPDQAKRDNKGGSLQQKDQLFVQVVLNGTQLFAGVVPACKAKVQAKGQKDAATINRGNWSVSCSKKANDTLALTDQQLTDLQPALGKKVVGKSSLNLQGKCRDANCSVVLPPA